jgi:hypothetical protein
VDFSAQWNFAQCHALAPVGASIGMSNEALQHDPEKWVPVFPRDKRETRLRGDPAQIKEIERDDE